MMQTVGLWALCAICVAVALYCLHRLALWMEGKGWLYYSKRGSGNVGNALMSVQAIMEPNVQHIVDVRNSQEKAEDWQGDDDDSRRDRHE